MTPEHATLMGWERSVKRLNHATRRQFKKAADRGVVEQFAQGWHLRELFRLLFGSFGGTSRQDHEVLLGRAQ